MVVLESLAGTDVYVRLICLHLRMEIFCLQYQIQCAVREEAVSGRLKGSMNQLGYVYAVWSVRCNQIPPPIKHLYKWCINMRTGNLLTTIVFFLLLSCTIPLVCILGWVGIILGPSQIL